MLLYSRLVLSWLWVSNTYTCEPGYTKLAERAGSVLQMNEQLDVSESQYLLGLTVTR